MLPRSLRKTWFWSNLFGRRKWEVWKRKVYHHFYFLNCLKLLRFRCCFLSVWNLIHPLLYRVLKRFIKSFSFLRWRLGTIFMFRICFGNVTNLVFVGLFLTTVTDRLILRILWWSCRRQFTFVLIWVFVGIVWQRWKWVFTFVVFFVVGNIIWFICIGWFTFVIIFVVGIVWRKIFGFFFFFARVKFVSFRFLSWKGGNWKDVCFLFFFVFALSFDLSDCGVLFDCFVFFLLRSFNMSSWRICCHFSGLNLLVELLTFLVRFMFFFFALTIMMIVMKKIMIRLGSFGDFFCARKKKEWLLRKKKVQKRVRVVAQEEVYFKSWCSVECWRKRREGKKDDKF